MSIAGGSSISRSRKQMVNESDMASIAIKGSSKVLQQRLESHITWADSPYEKSTYRKWDLKVTTSRGLLVRTKSEALIVEKLYEYGIPFRYEQILWIDDSLIVPDFTFETASGDELFWEHAGMLENMYYSFRHHLKMMHFAAPAIIKTIHREKSVVLW